MRDVLMSKGPLSGPIGVLLINLLNEVPYANGRLLIIQLGIEHECIRSRDVNRKGGEDEN